MRPSSVSASRRVVRSNSRVPNRSSNAEIWRLTEVSELGRARAAPDRQAAGIHNPHEGRHRRQLIHVSDPSASRKRAYQIWIIPPKITRTYAFDNSRKFMGGRHAISFQRAVVRKTLARNSAPSAR